MKKIALALLAALVLGCSGSEGSDDPIDPGSSGTITITSTTITGQSGKFLVVFAVLGGVGTPAGRACVPITSDNFTVPPTALVENVVNSNPCDPANETKSFPAGSYTLTASIYIGGSQTAEKSISRTVQVSGSVTASFDGAALSR